MLFHLFVPCRSAPIAQRGCVLLQSNVRTPSSLSGGSNISRWLRLSTAQQTSGRAFPVVSFVDLSVECPFDKFYGINCRPKLGAKLLDRFLHRRRQVSPPVNGLTHRFFDGSQHFLYCNFTIGSRHGTVASSSSRQAAEHGRAIPLPESLMAELSPVKWFDFALSAGLPRQYLRTKGIKPQFPLSCSDDVRFAPYFIRGWLGRGRR
jgi:hypothetical protein